MPPRATEHNGVGGNFVPPHVLGSSRAILDLSPIGDVVGDGAPEVHEFRDRLRDENAVALAVRQQFFGGVVNRGKREEKIGPDGQALRVLIDQALEDVELLHGGANRLCQRIAMVVEDVEGF